MSGGNGQRNLTRRQVELLERPNCAVCGIAVTRQSSELINGRLWCLSCHKGKPRRRHKASALTPEERRIVMQHRRVLLKLDPRCSYCGIQLTRKSATIDHIVPKSKGGSSSEFNLALACKPCNGRKADAVFADTADITTWLNSTTIEGASVSLDSCNQSK